MPTNFQVLNSVVFEYNWRKFLGIGNVEMAGLSGETAPRRIVRIQMRVDAGKLKDIPVDSEAAISAENVLGTKYINIKMGKSRQMVRDGGEVPSKDVSEFDEVVQSGYDVVGVFISELMSGTIQAARLAAQTVRDEVPGVFVTTRMNVYDAIPYPYGFGVSRDDLIVAQIFANEAPTRKWRRFGARGRFKPVLRRSSHVTIILSEREAGK